MHWTTEQAITADERRLAPLMARGTVVVVTAALCVAGFLHVLSARLDLHQVVLALASMTALSLLQLLYFSDPAARTDTRAGQLVLVAQACLVYLPITYYGDTWIGMPGFLAGDVLLVLPPVAAWPPFALIVASMAVIEWLLGRSAVDISYTTMSTVVTGLLVFGLSRLAALVGQMHAARDELAKMAVVQERLRIARDLHDMLGYSLSAIALKCELAHRLVPDDPDRARAELAEVLQVSRKALTDIRAVSTRYRGLSVDEEIRSVTSVLAAAGVRAEVELAHADLPEPMSDTIALLVREGVTNVIRHSKATWCRITVAQSAVEVRVEILNDGAPEAASDGDGAGLRNLTARVSDLSGLLCARREDPDGLFRLSAVLPWEPRIPSQRATERTPGG